MKTIHDCQILQKMLPLNFTRPDDSVNQRCISDRRHFIPYAMKLVSKPTDLEKIWMEHLDLWVIESIYGQTKLLGIKNFLKSLFCLWIEILENMFIPWKGFCCNLMLPLKVKLPLHSCPQLLPCTVHSGEKSNCCTIPINSCHAEWLQPKNVANDLIHYPLSQIWVQLIPNQCLKKK